MKYRAVLFDFDYTLGDSTKGIVLSANAALQRMGLEAQSEEAIRRTVGLSLRDTYRALTGDENPQAADSFAAFFREKADQVMAESAVLYPSVPPLLKALRSQGLRMGVVTTKFRYRILQILGKYGLTDSVDCIIGAEDVKEESPLRREFCLPWRGWGCGRKRFFMWVTARWTLPPLSGRGWPSPECSPERRRRRRCGEGPVCGLGRRLGRLGN